MTESIYSILKNVKNIAEEKTGRDIDKIVFTFPPIDHLNIGLINTFKEVCKDIGFNQVYDIKEPVAAISAFQPESQKSWKYKAVVHFGGRSLRISLLEDKESVIVKDTHCFSNIGGDSIDKILLNKILYKYQKYVKLHKSNLFCDDFDEEIKDIVLTQC